MYFEGDPYNAKDRFLQSVGRPERLIAKPAPLPAGAERGTQALRFDLVATDRIGGNRTGVFSSRPCDCPLPKAGVTKTSAYPCVTGRTGEM
jgi:hypothetical protein